MTTSLDFEMHNNNIGRAEERIKKCRGLISTNCCETQNKQLGIICRNFETAGCQNQRQHKTTRLFSILKKMVTQKTGKWQRNR